MTKDIFYELTEEQIDYCMELLDMKREGYAPCAVGSEDCLRAFKKAAALQGTTSRHALFGMLAKHLVSIADLCKADKPARRDVWKEKITDAINYLFLLNAVVKEELDDQ